MLEYHRTYRVPLVGSPDTVREWPVMDPLVWRLLPPGLVPTMSQWAVSWLVWPPVKVTDVLVKVAPGLGVAMGAGKVLEVVVEVLVEVVLLLPTFME